MGRTGNFGGFVFDEEIFTGMMEEEDYFSYPIIASGVVRKDSSVMSKIGAEGNVATIPIAKPFNVHDSNMEALNNDGLTNNTPVEIKGDKQTCMMIQRMKAFKAKDFTAELTGADPIKLVQKRISKYYEGVWENELMNIVQAVLEVSELSEHVLDLSVTSGSIEQINKIDEVTHIDAEQAALGDMAGGLGLIVMHSKIFAAYKKLKLVEYAKYVDENSIVEDIELPTIGGKQVLVTDYYTVDTSTVGFPIFKTYLLGEGAFIGCDKNNYKKQYTTDYNPESSAGIEMLYTKQGKVLHPNGLSLNVDNIEKESPTFEELGKKDNWTLKFNHKNVKIGMIKSNG